MTTEPASAHDPQEDLPALDQRDLNADPFEQFTDWYETALRSELPEPTAMTLATADQEGRPAARVVLLKSYDRRGFVFHTNYQSRKVLEIDRNPRAALVLFWQPLHRQIRIEGSVERISPRESDAYFAGRPRGAQLAAVISAQSGTVAERSVIERRLAELRAEFEGKEIARPANWGGLRVVPSAFEFWQGRENRLHDRFRFELGPGGTWKIERLWP